MIEPDRWEQIERFYHATLEHEPNAREAFLDEACAGDGDLRREVVGLHTTRQEFQVCAACYT